jgi:hypothetical protein
MDGRKFASIGAVFSLKLLIGERICSFGRVGIWQNAPVVVKSGVNLIRR